MHQSGRSPLLQEWSFGFSFADMCDEPFDRLVQHTNGDLDLSGIDACKYHVTENAQVR